MRAKTLTTARQVVRVQNARHGRHLIVDYRIQLFPPAWRPAPSLGWLRKCNYMPICAGPRGPVDVNHEGDE